MDIVRVNEADRTIEVSETKDHVKDAPNFDDDEDITAEYERRIRDHFGLQSTDASTSRGSYAAFRDGDRDGRRVDERHRKIDRRTTTTRQVAGWEPAAQEETASHDRHDETDHGRAPEHGGARGRDSTAASATGAR